MINDVQLGVTLFWFFVWSVGAMVPMLAVWIVMDWFLHQFKSVFR